MRRARTLKNPYGVYVITVMEETRIMFPEDVFAEDCLSGRISEGRQNALNNNSQHEDECSQEAHTGNRLLHRK